MGKNSLHNHSTSDKAFNQNNEMSEDPKDGSRDSFTLGKDGSTPVETKPPQDRQDQSAVEAFGEEGAGVASKE